MVTLVSDDEDGECDDFNDLFDFDDWGEETGREERWLPSIAAARPDVTAGDMRLLYLAWLLCLQNGDLDGAAPEPPLPAGLAHLPEPLGELAAFLRIDRDLISAAAEPLPTPAPQASRTAWKDWLATLTHDEKDAALLQLLHGNDPQVIPDLRRRFHASRSPAAAPGPARTVTELRDSVLAHTACCLAREQQAEAEHRHAARQREEAAQQRRISAMKADPEAAWTGVTQKIAYRTGRDYPGAVQILNDLAILAEQSGTGPAFTERYRRLREEHRAKKALQRLLDDSGP
ncbi:hypothetical protein IPZ58_16805 [Streptomyces roseoverticillatus]|uniref:hypothetical protein n=1 Tax=Streptomyces roseoverticillatus TaxID=66429 RepID=UPI001F157B7B|nr:hypothetical protein [Streptomyces roseoverticillatus]MCF3103226.1 hypothetical protein [Streptomyces roseoverticillatus]